MIDILGGYPIFMDAPLKKSKLFLKKVLTNY